MMINNFFRNLFRSSIQYKFYILVLIALFALSENSYATCTSPANNGNASCVEEGDAQVWVRDINHQRLACGSAAQNIANVTFEGNSFNRIANFICYSTEPANGSYAYIVASFEQDCSTRNATSNARLSFAGEFPSCRAGCQVDFNGSNVTSSTSNSSFGMVTMTTGIIQYTGNACPAPPNPATTPDPPDAPSDPTQQCTQVGSLTQCLRTDGQMCATASNGTQLCWPAQAPSEQTSLDGAIAVSPSNVPPTTPANMEPTGETVTTQTTINNNGTTTVTNTTVNTYTNTGTCPAGTTGTPPNCAPDEGSTCPAGQTGTPPNCSPDGETGGTGPAMSDSYSPKNKTVQSVYGEFRGKIDQAPIITSVDTFLDLSGIGAECPVFEVPFFNQIIVIDAFCNPTVLQVFGWIGLVILCFAVYRAFMICVS